MHKEKLGVPKELEHNTKTNRYFHTRSFAKFCGSGE